MNRRNFVQRITGMTIAPATVVTLDGREKRRPEKLERGQRWRDREGWIAVVIRPTHGPYWHVEWFHPNEAYPYRRDAVSAYRSWCDFKNWTYLGKVGALGGSR